MSEAIALERRGSALRRLDLSWLLCARRHGFTHSRQRPGASGDRAIPVHAWNVRLSNGGAVLAFLLLQDAG